jgi:hypothetical protein
MSDKKIQLLLDSCIQDRNEQINSQYWTISEMRSQQIPALIGLPITQYSAEKFINNVTIVTVLRV